MASTVTERVELAKLCRSKDWSKAIRILDSLVAQSCAIQDICNRAFCYSQLELHKHVIKDCDKALQLDPTLLQAYIFKGRALFAMGRKEEALSVWEQGYEQSVSQTADLKQLLELEELLAVAKRDIPAVSKNGAMESLESPGPASESSHLVSIKSSNMIKNKKRSNGEFQIRSKPSDTVVTHGGSEQRPDTAKGESNYEVKDIKKPASQENGTYTRQPNGTGDVSNGLHDQSAICGELSDNSESANKSSVVTCESSNTSEVHSQSSDDSHNDSTDEAKRSERLYVTRISRTKSISVDFRLSRGIAQVNEGNYTQAISIFDQILHEEPTYPEALIGRGTAYAFQRELDSAISDFTKAIQSNPAAGEAWKRRGQARAALGEFSEAIKDLTEALKFEPNLEDILHERGIVNFKYKDFKAAVEDLSECVKLDKYNKSAYTYLGLALSALGEYKRAEEAHKKSIQLDRTFVEAWAHLAQFYQELANVEKAMASLQQLLQIDERFAKAYHLRGLLLHGMGEHRNAIKELSVGLSIDSSNVDCLYLRGSCHHAIGEYKEAVKDYDAALDLELDSMDKFVLQCLAFYQKEIALYTASKLNSEFCWFDIDGDIDPLFKEYWCKRLHPKNVCEKVYRQPALRDSLRKGKHKKQDVSLNKQKISLLQAADAIGKKIQYHCPGFLPNKRQHRMAGLAAIEIAQKVSKFWRSMQAEWKNSNKPSAKYGKKIRRKDRTNPPSQNRGGAGCSTSSSSETSTLSSSMEGLPGRYTMSWRDVYSLAVRWRQISEPCDPVVWVNKLSEEFNSGFGSHTPIVLGQAKVVRYFPNFKRTLNVAKAVIKENKYVRDKKDNIIYLTDEGKLKDIINAESCSDLYKAIGDDFWLATRCNSTAFEGKSLEGTRITLVKMGDIGFDFAIRTPCTPSRWDEFNVEMTSAWEALCDAYNGEIFGTTDFDALETVREAILRMTYYWYNFMPLSRGTAVVGLIVMFGLLLASNMEFTGSIPEGLQVDWEAILSLDPNQFINCVKSWLYPSLKTSTSWKGYPDVSSTFETTGSVIAALSTYSD